LILGIQLLHGLSFGLYLIGSVTYVNEEAPAGLETTALSLLGIISFGLASISGAFIGGILYDTAGLVVLFQVLSLIAFGSLIITLSIQNK
jgi:PPP family 3-phenylpropionic acid transporter